MSAFGTLGGGGGGTISGPSPASSTDNAVTRWDGTGGTTLQNSTVLMDDSGNVTQLGTANNMRVSPAHNIILQTSNGGL
jgi:hypothetical protein